MKTHYFDTLCFIDFSNLQSNDNKLQNRLDGLVFKEAINSWQLIDANHLHLHTVKKTIINARDLPKLNSICY